MTTIQIEYIPIDQIHEYKNNPRENDKAVPAVMRSIQRFGVQNPAIVDRDNVLIAGHTRIKAARQLGMTEFPCVRADDLTKAQARAFRLADNRMQEDSAWDTKALADEFKALRNNGFDLGDTGFAPFEIDSFSFAPQPDYTQRVLQSDAAPADGTQSDAAADASPVSYNSAETGDADSDRQQDSDPAPVPLPQGLRWQPHTADSPQASPADDYEHDPEAEDDSAYAPSTEFVCILCCKDEAEKQAVAAILGEPGELHSHYSCAELRELLRA